MCPGWIVKACLRYTEVRVGGVLPPKRHYFKIFKQITCSEDKLSICDLKIGNRQDDFTMELLSCKTPMESLGGALRSTSQQPSTTIGSIPMAPSVRKHMASPGQPGCSQVAGDHPSWPRPGRRSTGSAPKKRRNENCPPAG